MASESFKEWLASDEFTLAMQGDYATLRNAILAKHEEAVVNAVATAAACCQSDYSEMLTDLKIALKAASVALGDIARRDREMQMTEMRCIARDTKSIVDYALLEKKP